MGFVPPMRCYDYARASLYQAKEGLSHAYVIVSVGFQVRRLVGREQCRSL